MLSALLACSCETSEDGDAFYVRWVAHAMHLCVYADNARDVVALIALCIHVAAWLILYIPQLYLNWRLRSASSQSLLYVSFLLLSELCFLIASLLEQFGWFWSAFRIWRLVMISMLVAQILYYKLWAKPELEHMELYGDDSALVDGSVEYDESSSSAFGWAPRPPKRGPSGSPIAGVNIDSTGNKASGAGFPSSWGESLLASGSYRSPAVTSTRSHSPARIPSRAAAAQKPTLTQVAPRDATSSTSPPAAASARAVVAAPVFVPSAVASNAPAPSAGGAASLPPSLSASGSFHASSTSAFRPVVHTETVGSSAVAVDFGQVATTSTTTHSGGYTLLSRSSTNQKSPVATSSSSAKLLTLGFCVVGLTFLSMGGVLSHDSAWSDATSPAGSDSAPLQHAGRVLLQSLSNAATDPRICNQPYDPPTPTVYAIRVFSWLGCVFACMSPFPQIILNSEWTRSTAGLSFITFGLLLLANFAWLIGTAIPRHNDWLDNRYARAGADGSAFYRDQVVLPLLIAHGFTALATFVFIVQRRKYSQTK